ncbi:MAG: hypothetical protein FD145_999 [Candidatus Saganbacteria bacterium]|uniref:Organic solvent tolerance-like N-terminal domain-containing protein n=1 Tax=Candidatus Saganbacteria bacterium TaxID=2575572 RepID=A0A833L0P8_UNCSA|nr:MAG: hypothetical protein FD145_999 [Candidatus Saganbacteria bacterium]
MLSAITFAAENEIPVNIKADKLKYSEDTDTIFAQGSVEMQFENINIKSDSLAMNSKTKIITAEGNVIMKSSEYNADGDFMTYFLSDETALFSNFKTKLSPEGVKGNIYLSAQYADNQKLKWLGKKGAMTTCDYYNSPHYKNTAYKMEYYPNDKIIGYSVTFYVGSVPCMWAPYVVYDLKKKSKRNWTFGHNEVEGDFVKTFWDYPAGVYLIDYMSKKGLGLGIEHNYSFKQNGTGKLYLYLLNESDFPNLKDRVVKINHEIKLTPYSTLSLFHNSSSIYLVPSGRLDLSSYRIELNHQNGDRLFNTYLDTLDDRTQNLEKAVFNISNQQNGVSSQYNYSIEQGKIAPYKRVSQRLSHSQPLPLKNTKFNLYSNYSFITQDKSQPGDELLDLNYEIVNSGDFYNISIAENKHIDLDRSLYAKDDSDQFVEKLPEVILNINPYDLKLFTFRPTIKYGKYREVRYVPNFGMRDYSTYRYSTIIGAEKTIPLVLGTSLLLSGGLEQHIYEPGDQLYAFSESISLDTELFSIFKNSADFSRGIAEGNSPFFFDKQGTKYSHIKDTINLFYLSYINWMITGGYNYETKKYFNIDTNLSLNPFPFLKTNFISGWSIEEQKYLDLQSTFGFKYNDMLSNDTSFLSDLNTGYLKSGSNYVNLEFGDEKEWPSHFHLQAGHTYLPQTQEIKLQEISVLKDLHCWDIKYSYSDFRREFSMTFTLKAFPGDPIGYSQNKGFQFESLEKSLKEEFQGASPSRY